MRVLEIIHGLTVGGAEIDLLGKLARLATLPGWDIAVCCLMRRGPLADQAEAAGIKLLGPLMHQRYDLAAGFQIRQLLQSQPWHLVHSHLFAANLVTAAVYHSLPASTCPPLICSEHAMAERWDQASIWAYRNIIGRKARLILFPSQASLDGYADRGLNKEELAVFPNSIDPQRFQAIDHTAARQTWRENMHISPTDLLIGCVSRLETVKGVHHLLDAFARIAKDNPTKYLVIAGEGSQRIALETQIQQLGLAPRVHLIGRCSEVPSFLAASDIFVLPSLSESFGLAAAEALLMEVPVIASRVGGIPEAVGGEAGAYLVPPADPIALASALCTVAADLPAAQARARIGRKHVLTHFNLNAVSDRLQTLYQELN